MSKKVPKTDVTKYDKKSPREHILLRPDTYIGDIEPTTEKMWIWKESKIVKEDITYTPGFLKIFDEILVNARDASVNDSSCDTIKVEYNKEEGYISVFNNGDKGIPIEEHPEHKVLVPSMIFGELLTSSNYDDDEKRTTGGRNGYGSKLVSVFSKKFTVEIVDAKRKKKFIQVWKDNMSIAEPAKVTEVKAANPKSYVKVTFVPDLEKFKVDNLDNDHYNLFYRRTIDLAGVTEGKLKVSFNDEKIDANTFKSYIDLYYPGEEIFYDIDKRWGVGCLYKPDAGGEVISFVNGISTYKGGTHCNHVIDNILKVVINDHIKKKDKDIKVTPALLKENLIFFINATIENPAFASQTKDTLTTKTEKFGSKYEPTQVFLKKIAKCGIVEQIIQLMKFKESTNLKKTDGKKQVKISGIPKLDDANKAGTKDSSKCCLILTEGDSAKAFAMAGLGLIGRDYFGVFPLKGKLLNVREATTKQLSDNEEINNLKQIIGLKHGVNYADEANFNQLRYGRILILTDQDVDGSHIKGLLMNFIHCVWPSLIKKTGFITSLSTPIVKATKGKDVLIFYNLSEYDKWKETPESNGYKTKYYKGLGTSTSDEAKEYFVGLEDKLIKYFWVVQTKDAEEKDLDEDAITLAFDKTRADDRKAWLMNYNKNAILKYEDKKISYRDFINLDLKHFSNDDNSRSIPSLIDGFKPSQRKILYGAALRGLDKDEVKVAQLAGFVSDKAAYHHGEASLMGAIIGMAQDYVGANNINVLKPNGQFGCVDPETNVLLWDSTIKKAKDVIVGDKLIGDDGSPRIVSKTIKGVDTMYKIKNGNMDDYIVNSNHILTCQLSGHKSIYWKESNKTWKMLYYDAQNKTFKEKSISTNELIGNHFNKSTLSKQEAYDKMIEFSRTIQDSPIFDINLQNYLKLPKYIKHSIKGLLNSSVIQWEEQMVDIDPYILGAWLGDGMSDCHAFASIDHEIIKSWAIWLDSIGCETVHCSNTNEHESCTYYIRRRGSGKDNTVFPIGDKNNSHETCKGCKTSKIITTACDWTFEKKESEFKCNGININNNEAVNLNPFKQIMKANKLYKNKHVPINYILNSKENRLQLLAGMIDTDGCLRTQKNVHSYSIAQNVKRKHMLESFRIIAGSLGYRAKILECKNNMLELRITGLNLHEIPVRIERKKIKDNIIKQNPMIHKIEVEKIDKGNFCGWHIDSNERFLLADFTITHNTRLKGGKDAASPRYIWTMFEALTSKIFMSIDDPILEKQDDDGLPIEPVNYAPIIPMLLVNGAKGIGTGFSTTIPQFNPKDIITNIKNKLTKKSYMKMHPWYKGFEGEVRPKDDNSYEIYGKWEIKGDKLMITELPVGEWSSDYKEFLEKLLEDEPEKKDAKKKVEKKKNPFLGYSDNNTDKKVNFTLDFEPGYLGKQKDLESTYHLVRKVAITNMHLYNKNGAIQKYDTIEQIMDEYFDVRLDLYQKRKDYLLNELENQLKLISWKVKFILLIVEKKLEINNKKKVEIEAELLTKKFPKIDNSYNYLLTMPIYNLTNEKIEELKKQKNEKETEFNSLVEKTPEKLWLTDLENLEESYDKWYLLTNKKPSETKVKKTK